MRVAGIDKETDKESKESKVEGEREREWIDRNRGDIGRYG
jgi:hypothetical protein